MAVTSRTKVRTAPAKAEGSRLREARSRIGMPRTTFARLMSMSERSLADYEAGKPLTETVRRRLTEVERLQQALARVVRSEAIGPWLQEPNAAFDGLKPLEVIERGQTDRIWRMVHYLESGQGG